MFNVKDYGVTGDGQTVETAKLQAVIDQCSAAGGGTVYFPGGTFLTGTLTIPSFVTLNISTGATLLGSPSMDDYPHDSLVHHGDRTGYHLLRVHSAEQVTITGGGVIDGNGPYFWDSPENPKGSTVVNKETGNPRYPAQDVNDPNYVWRGFRLALSKLERPSPAISIVDCHDIRIEGVTLKDTPGWAVHVCRTQRVWIRGISILNPMDGPNSDGLDIDGCTDVFISDCYIINGDDSIVIFSAPGNGPCERITINNCVIATRCAAIKIYAHEPMDYDGINSDHPIRQVTASNCVFYNSERAVSIYQWGAGVFEDLHFSNFVIETGTTPPNFAERALQIDVGTDNHCPPDAEIGIVRNVTWENMTVRTPGRIIVAARPSSVQNLRIRNITFAVTGTHDLSRYANPTPSPQQFARDPQNAHVRAVPAHFAIRGVDDLLMENITIRDESGGDLDAWHGLHLEYVNNSRIRDFVTYEPQDGFEQIHQQDSENITVE